MPLFIDQLQLTQRSAINSHDEEAASNLFSNGMPTRTGARVSTAYSSRQRGMDRTCETADAGSDDCTSHGKKRRVSRLERQLHSAEKKACLIDCASV